MTQSQTNVNYAATQIISFLLGSMIGNVSLVDESGYKVAIPAAIFLLTVSCIAALVPWKTRTLRGKAICSVLILISLLELADLTFRRLPFLMLQH
jgi:hypothetical protein